MMFLLILVLGLLLMFLSGFIYVLRYGIDAERFILTVILVWGVFMVTAAIIKLGWILGL